jgi:hypothetical protein
MNGWYEPPFLNQLCVKDDVLNKTFLEYRKDYTSFFKYSTITMCNSEENKFI